MIKSLISLFLIISAINVFADGVWIDNIYYNLNKSTNEAEVADFQPQSTPEKVKSIDFNTYNVGDMPCTNKNTSTSQLAKIVKYDNQNVLSLPSQSNVNIIEGFEIAPNATYTITFWAKCDKGSTFRINFSGNVVDGTATKDGKWSITEGKWTGIVVVAKAPEGVTEGFLEVGMVRGSQMYIQKVEVNAKQGENVEIPEKITSQGEEYIVTSIGNDAFFGCSELNSLTIPNSVHSIGAGAFQDCSFLASVTIGNSVTSIGNEAFKNCSGLTSVTIPNSVTSIGDGGAFYGCDNVKELIYAEGTRTVLATGLHSITSVTIPNSVTSIGERAFGYCRGLSSVTIPNSVTSIGNQAFEDCSSLTSITIPDAVTSIGNQAFEDCSSLTSVTIGKSVTSIGNSAFSRCYELTSVTIPNSVTSIGNSAFHNCSNLTSITIPNSVTSIGKNAFNGCSSLASVTIPNSVTSIGEDAFCNCSGLTSVNIGNSVTNIGNSAFISCPNLISVIVDQDNPNYSSIDNVLFNKDKTELIYCANGKSGAYSIPNSVTSIGRSAFYSCSSLTSVTIPNSVTSIGNQAFGYCSSLTSVTIPNSVTSIGDYAFYHCSELTSVSIGNSVTSIGRSTFNNCSNLTSMIVDQANPNYCTIDNVLFNKDKTELIYCARGKSGTYSIPNSVTSIGEDAFAYCSYLTSVAIPNSVTSIGDYAFYHCNNLENIYCYAKKGPSYNPPFDDDVYKATLYVPSRYVTLYENTYPWYNFSMILPIEDVDGIEDVKLSDNKSNRVNIYTINGEEIKSNNLPAGIYIKNGKKVIVK